MGVAVELLVNGQRQNLVGQEGQTLWELLMVTGWGNSAYCGGQGLCGKCVVRVDKGLRAPHDRERQVFTAEQLQEGRRLACLTVIVPGMVVQMETVRSIHGLVDGPEGELSVAPTVRSHRVIIDDANQQDRFAALRQQCQASWSTCQDLVGLSLLSHGQETWVIATDDTLLQISSSQRVWGVAVDIGTTTLATYLRDLSKGQLLAVDARENPQRRFGADCLSRVAFTQHTSEGRVLLAKVLIGAIDEALRSTAVEAGGDPSDIAHVVLVGNTVMLHTLLGVSAESITQAPFSPVFTEWQAMLGKCLGLQAAPKSLVELLPAVAGYVGADIVADLLAIRGSHSDAGSFVLLDIGTNGEIVLHHDGRYWCCAAAAGPAFEGASISCGLPGVDGAIANYWWDSETKQFAWQTLGNVQPQGVCGSGLIDATATLVEQGYLDQTGLFQMRAGTEIELHQGKPAFRLVPNLALFLTQKDIREVQLAKAALRAGIEILLAAAGVKYEDVDQVFLAGGFGQSLNEASAAAIGVFPDIWKRKVKKVGNAAGVGAQRYLLDQKNRAVCDEIRKRMQYVELAVHGGFEKAFMEAMYFPE